MCLLEPQLIDKLSACYARFPRHANCEPNANLQILCLVDETTPSLTRSLHWIAARCGTPLIRGQTFRRWRLAISISRAKTNRSKGRELERK
jgi:hypothetical protein